MVLEAVDGDVGLRDGRALFGRRHEGDAPGRLERPEVLILREPFEHPRVVDAPRGGEDDAYLHRAAHVDGLLADATVDGVGIEMMTAGLLTSSRV